MAEEQKLWMRDRNGRWTCQSAGTVDRQLRKGKVTEVAVAMDPPDLREESKTEASNGEDDD